MKTSILISSIPLALFLLVLPDNYQENKQRVPASELKDWVSYLSSDEMKGRANGSPEMKTAANWIAEKFRENGVKPIYPDDDYLQSYSITSRQRTIEERNVIGVIEGSDPLLKDQYLVLSAHFDHVGVRRGASPDSIRNGADDNASGTCTLLGIARNILLSKVKPGRTLIFAAFSGEELGIRGSRSFVSNTPVPLKNIYADLNFEMTCHSEYLGKNKYYMTGCSLSNLDDLIIQHFRTSDYQLVDTISLANMLFTASDNIAFSRISVTEGKTLGIPSGTFATSALTDYLHNVTDEADLCDFDNMAGLVQYFTDMVIWLSYNKSDIKWTDPGYTRPE